MKRINILLLVLLSRQILPSQNTFNTVIATDQFYVNAIYQPLIELDSNNLMTFFPSLFRFQHGGNTFKLVLNKNGVLKLLDSINDNLNSIYSADCIKFNHNHLCSGKKFIASDTLYVIWLAMIDDQGKVIWEKNYYSFFNRPSIIRSCSLGNGNFGFAGTNDQQDPSSPGGASLAAYGLILISDSLGNIIHQLNINDQDTSTLEAYYGITTDSLGNLYACGIIYPGTLNNDAVIVKINQDGKLVWRKRIFSREYNEILNSAFLQKDGTLLFVGASANGDFFADKFNSVLLMNTDTSGRLLWEKRIYRSWDSYNASCIEDYFGNIICGGTARFKDTDRYDGWICKFSSTGDSIWSRVIDNFSSLSEQFYNISQASDGGYYLTGKSWVEGNNSAKAWIVKVDSFGCLVPGCQKVVATEDVSNGKIAFFEFFPNPAKDVFYFLSRITESHNYQIKVIDLQGREVFKYSFQPVSGKQYVVEIPEQLLSGIYTLSVFNEKGKMVQIEKLELY